MKLGVWQSDPTRKFLKLRCFNLNKKCKVFNTSSTRKRVHHKTRKNALACASSLYFRNFKTYATATKLTGLALAKRPVPFGHVAGCWLAG